MSSQYSVSAVALKRDKTKVDCPRRIWVSIEKGSSPSAPDAKGAVSGEPTMPRAVAANTDRCRPVVLRPTRHAAWGCGCLDIRKWSLTLEEVLNTAKSSSLNLRADRIPETASVSYNGANCILDFMRTLESVCRSENYKVVSSLHLSNQWEGSSLCRPV